MDLSWGRSTDLSTDRITAHSTDYSIDGSWGHRTRERRRFVRAKEPSIRHEVSIHAPSDSEHNSRPIRPVVVLWSVLGFGLLFFLCLLHSLVVIDARLFALLF